jgi:hypothetical protein
MAAFVRTLRVSSRDKTRRRMKVVCTSARHLHILTVAVHEIRLLCSACDCQDRRIVEGQV